VSGSVASPVPHSATDVPSDAAQTRDVIKIATTSDESPSRIAALADDATGSAGSGPLRFPSGEALVSLPTIAADRRDPEAHPLTAPVTVVGLLAPIRSGLIGAIAERLTSSPAGLSVAEPTPPVRTHRPPSRPDRSAGEASSGVGILLLAAVAALGLALITCVAGRRRLLGARALLSRISSPRLERPG
jgi:hypothetical protein